VEDSRIRIAAAGDIHCSEATRGAVAAAFDEAERDADLILLAGDLTTHGEPEQAAVLADICRGRSVPVIAVLGNHDWHLNRCDAVVAELEAGGISVLQRGWTVREVRETRVGIAGTKGFVGGFPDSELPDFGEPLLRAVYADTTAEVEALERALSAIADCPLRIALLHYSPTTTTLEGEPRVIWAFLGSSRLAVPIARHQPDLVLHGHGHAGRFEGSIGDVPVYNVAVPVMGRDFWIFELEGGMETPAEQPEIHVEAEAAQAAAGPH
jgi:Icc-related predicted phosphoesterase